LSTFDSFELGRYSDDSNKETEDKVAGERVIPATLGNIFFSILPPFAIL